MRVATAEQMRRMDKMTIEEWGVPSTLLMERAAKGLADEAIVRLEAPEGKHCAVFCGAGNNGGDGVAAARRLTMRGLNVRAFLVGKREKMTADCMEMERRLAEMGGRLEPFDSGSEEQKSFCRNADLLVDAIFGIGLNSSVRGDALTAIEWMNESAAFTVAADIPSGVETDTGRVLGAAVQADCTVTFTLPKAGHFLGKGGLHTGRLLVQNIGIPGELVDREEYRVSAVTGDMVKKWLPRWEEDVHKGNFGKAYILAGSVGYTGAPILASKAAVRSGAGLVHLGVPQDIYEITAVRCMEAMPWPLAAKDGGLAEQALPEVLAALQGKSACLIGPGMGRSAGVDKVVLGVLRYAALPVVLDADGINAAAEHIDSLDGREAPTVLTPHDGEFIRLGGDLSGGDRLGAAREFARIHGCILVLKGHCTITALPDGRAWLNTTGNAGMAKGGSGDVLGGMMVSLLAQGMPPDQAAAAAVWLHGRAGDLCAAERGQRGMIPSDLIESLPKCWRELV